MAEQNDHDYYQRLAIEEREVARTAHDALAAAIHILLAERFQNLAMAAARDAAADLRIPNERLA